MFFAIKNLTATDVAPLEKPWEWVPASPVPAFASKDAWRRWCNSDSTDHCFFCGVEGLAPGVRVSPKQGNDAYKLHALVVDYDGAYGDDVLYEKAVKECDERPACEFKPAWVSRTKHGVSLRSSASSSASRTTCLSTSAWLPAWNAWR